MKLLRDIVYNRHDQKLDLWLPEQDGARGGGRSPARAARASPPERA